MSDSASDAPPKKMSGGDPVRSIAELIETIISSVGRFLAFCGLVATLFGFLLLGIWLIPKILHVNTSKLTISSKGSEIELKSSTADQDQYYLIVSPQTTWQPTHVCFKRGNKLDIVADGRVNVDFHGLWKEIEDRIKLEEGIESKHPHLRTDLNHTPEEYFSEEEWKSLIPRHYWSGPDGDAVVTPTSFMGRQQYKIAPDQPYGALLGTIMSQEDVDSNGQPPAKSHDVFVVGRHWPDSNKDEGAPAKGCLWLAVNDVVEPQSAFPNAKDIKLSDIFLLDNLGFYRVVVTTSH